MGSSIKNPQIFICLMLLVFLFSLSCSAKIDGDDEFKSVWNVIEVKTPKWIEFSRKLDPEFDDSNFYLENSGVLKHITEYSYTKYIPEWLDSLYSIYYYVYSPDRTKYLDIYSVSAELAVIKGEITALGQADVAAFLIDLKNDKRSMYISCGTTCCLDDAAWIDNDSFIVTGYYETTHSAPFLYNASIQYINLKEKIHKKYTSTRSITHLSGYYGYKFPKFVE